jgi:hypothetical protein
MSDQTEVWRPAPGFEGAYEVSNLGRVRRRATGLVRKPALIKRTGYYAINLSVRNQQKMVSVHRLVAVAFLGLPPSPTHEVNHRDGNKANCAATNLEWSTASENTLHAVAHGLRASIPPCHHGDQHPRAKLDAAGVLVIRASNEPRRILAARYGVSLGAIKAVRSGRNWKKVA